MGLRRLDSLAQFSYANMRRNCPHLPQPDSEMTLTNSLSDFLNQVPPEIAISQDRGYSLLYHYTSFSGLDGIFSSKQMWCSCIHFMNDYSEYKHGLSLARHELNERIKSETRNDVKLLLASVESQLEGMDELHIFVSCLSEKRDTLSQWRGYAKNGGVSIGFNFDFLRNGCKSRGWSLVKCIYENKEKRKIIADLIEITISNLGAATVDEEEIGNCTRYFVNEFTLLAASFKDRNFDEEAEWRIVSPPLSMDDSNIGFRPASTLLIPFYRFDLPKLAAGDTFEIGVHDVTIGPNPFSELALFSVGALITNKRIAVKQWQTSSTPFRSI